MGSLPKAKREVDSQMLERVGFELATSIVEQESRKQLAQENQRLKQLISQM
jgi:cell shape-determining protein MreC